MAGKPFRGYMALLFVLAGISGVSHAQDRPYLVPQTVYVGDRASLVVPLAGRQTAGDTALDPHAPDFPSSPDIDIHRVALERRPSGVRLVIEFSAFAPGHLELPPIEIGGEYFSSLAIEIKSVMGNDKSGTVLSGLSPPLAIPGTGLLIYGTMAALVFVLLSGLWLMIWGRRRMGGWLLYWKRRRLIMSMYSIERYLRKSLLKEGSCRETLTIVSAEFRIFISFFSGENCRSMTPAELGRLAPLAETVDGAGILSGRFFGPFFRRCDDLRFSGTPIRGDEVLAVLGELRGFLGMLRRTKMKKTRGQAA